MSEEASDIASSRIGGLGGLKTICVYTVALGGGIIPIVDISEFLQADIMQNQCLRCSAA